MSIRIGLVSFLAFVAAIVLPTSARSQEWRKNIDWSWNNEGPCEEGVQSRVQQLDAQYHKNMYDRCVKTIPVIGTLPGPRGRKCLMQVYACDAAHNGFDQLAFDITVATQKHNRGAETSLNVAGVANVAKWLKERGCQK